MQTIPLHEVLKQLDRCRYQVSGDHFSMTYLTCDRSRRKGGQWRTVEKGQIQGLPYSVRDNEMRGLVDLASGIKSAFHIQLIFEFNGKRVVK